MCACAYTKLVTEEFSILVKNDPEVIKDAIVQMAVLYKRSRGR